MHKTELVFFEIWAHNSHAFRTRYTSIKADQDDLVDIRTCDSHVTKMAAESAKL